MLELLDKLLHQKVLAIYRSGSKIYGLETNKSDEDYTVIVDGEFQPNVIKEGGVDYFVFGKERFKQAVRIEEGCVSFFTIWIDNTCLALENLIYLDESYKEEFVSIIGEDWKPKFKKWLRLNLDYLGARLFNSPNEKTLYNIYRLNSIVKNYKNTGKFESVFNEEDKALALDFKANEQLRISHAAKLKEIFSYLESILKEDSL